MEHRYTIILQISSYIYIGTGTITEEDKFIGTKPNKTEKVCMSKDARMQQEHNQKCVKQMI